jgi:hypothetical protein
VQVLEQLLGKVLSQMPLLLRMLDNIALLDMLLAFFQAVTGMVPSTTRCSCISHSLVDRQAELSAYLLHLDQHVRFSGGCKVVQPPQLSKEACLMHMFRCGCWHDLAGSDGDWCRPVLSPSGPLAITKGRHPLLQVSWQRRPHAHILGSSLLHAEPVGCSS